MRRLRPDRNPLPRTADRAEAAATAMLLVVFLAGVPSAALAAAGWAGRCACRGAAVAVTGFLARRALDRRRLAAWDAEWSRTGPQWTGRV